jgi:hypothetical protein
MREAGGLQKFRRHSERSEESRSALKRILEGETEQDSSLRSE